MSEKRKKELLEAIENADQKVKTIVTPMIDDVVYLENELEKLKKLPFLRVHPKDSSKQEATPASKQYKELLQQYNNCVKILLSAVGKVDGDEDSALREGLQKLYEKYKY